MGGSADLAPSNLMPMKCAGDFLLGSYEGRNVRFGIRAGPADGNEPAGAYMYAVEWSTIKSRPAFMASTKQAVTNLPYSFIWNTARGAYAGMDCDDPDIVLVGTGSGVGLRVDATELLGTKVKMVSMPCSELFRVQPACYQEARATVRCAIPAAQRSS